MSGKLEKERMEYADALGYDLSEFDIMVVNLKMLKKNFRQVKFVIHSTSPENPG